MEQFRRRRRGQALVEFALVLPVFIILLLGLFDGGRLIYMNSTMTQAAREGARLASVEAGWIGSTDPSCNTVGGPVCPANANVLANHVQEAVNRMMAPFATIPVGSVYLDCSYSPPTNRNWTGQSCGSPYSGATVSVRVAAPFVPITPVIGTIPTTGAATMVIN